MKRMLQDLALAIVFLSTIFGYTMHEFAPDAWAQLLHVLGL